MVRRASVSAVVFGVVSVLTTGASAAVCDDPLTVGMSKWPPYNIKTDAGWEGIDADILKLLGKEMGCEIKFETSPWTRTKKLIEYGKIDIGTQAGITEKRKKYANFSNQYMKFQSALWVRTEDENDYKSLTDFFRMGKTLGIKKGFDYGDRVNRLVREKYASRTDSAESLRINARLLAYGRIDGMLGNPFVVGYRARQEGVIQDIQQSVVIQSEPVYFMLSKKSVSQGEIDAINDAIASLKETGKIQQVLKEYTGTTMQ